MSELNYENKFKAIIISSTLKGYGISNYTYSVYCNTALNLNVNPKCWIKLTYKYTVLKTQPFYG